MRVVFETVEAEGQSFGVIAPVARQLDIGTESLRNWVRQAEIHDGRRPGLTTEGARAAQGAREPGPLQQPDRQRTFVSAAGTISFSGSSHELTPWDPDGLLAFSEYDKPGDKCNGFGVKLSGSSHEWEGIVYAPQSLVQMSGSSNSTFHGSIIANTVQLNGSDLNITYNDELLPSLGDIKLVE